MSVVRSSAATVVANRLAAHTPASAAAEIRQTDHHGCPYNLEPKRYHANATIRGILVVDYGKRTRFGSDSDLGALPREVRLPPSTDIVGVEGHVREVPIAALRSSEIQLPLCTRSKHQLRNWGLSETCQLRPRAQQQTTRIVDHLVGAGEQRMRDCDLAELARVKRVNFPKAFAHERQITPKLCALASNAAGTLRPRRVVRQA